LHAIGDRHEVLHRLAASGLNMRRHPRQRMGDAGHGVALRMRQNLKDILGIK
jgi:hypothetical protein